MKIGEALQEVNTLKQQLVRLQRQRRNLFNPINANATGFAFEELSDSIFQKLSQINQFKLAIMKKNVSSNIVIEIEDDKFEINLMEAILKVTEFKSELSELESITSPDSQHMHFRMLQNQSNQQVFEPPLNEKELELKIRELENKKRMFNLAIQGANWKLAIDM